MTDLITSEEALEVCADFLEEFEYSFSMTSKSIDLRLRTGVFNDHHIRIQACDDESVYVGTILAQSVPDGFGSWLYELGCWSSGRVQLFDEQLAWGVRLEPHELADFASVDQVISWIERESFIAECVLELYERTKRFSTSVLFVGFGQHSEFDWRC
ncbi:MAG TPA: hypothetical protein VEB18_01500 [Candidatus Paceibacterota bacterium]|nr:hypothetical protein [Candidatus Paceibacterota bacterium]